MPIVREILNMFEFSRNSKIAISMNTLHRKEKVYPQIDKAFRCIDTYNRKTAVALWVHPFRGWKPFAPPFSMAKTSSSHFRTTPKHFFVGVKLHLPPPPPTTVL